jgi:S-adenosylmethionine:tRNA ribosyltransferase-isomerase
VGSSSLTLARPGVRHATEPPEARGLRRDEVRLLISHLDGSHEHRRFNELPGALRRGDLLVVNDSATLKASLPAARPGGSRVELHISTELPGNLRTVEVRQPDAVASQPLRAALAGETLKLAGGGRVRLVAPYPCTGDLRVESRLWAAALQLALPFDEYLDRFGAPIRYGHVPRPWPIDAYQTIFARHSGSAEMPSAGRPFTHELANTLIDAGVSIAAITLHTGVSSLEDHEPPYEERFRVSRTTADEVNDTHAAGGRVIAVGTTVVRALETVTDDRGVTHPGEGWTSLVITPGAPLHAIDGLLTGLHEPRASHLAMLRARLRGSPPLHGRPSLLEEAYREASEHHYLWHEFGDSHLILRG